MAAKQPEMRTLTEWRESKFLTIRELAEKIQVQPRTVWTWEHGSKPRMPQLKKLCEFFEVAPWQFDWETPKKEAA